MAEHKLAVKEDDPIVQMLMKYKKTIASVLPKHLTPERALRVASTVIFRTPKLRNCTPLSLVNGIIEISMLGLDLGRTAHLLPFGNEAIVIVDYKGYIDLAHRSNQINALSFKAVYENDEFDYQEGTDRYIKHKPSETDRGKLRAAYAICNYKHGGQDFELIFRDDAMAAKKCSPAKNSNSSPWNIPDQEFTMWCKTAVRRLSKRIPQSPELQRAVQLEDLVEAGLRQDLSHVGDNIIDAETIPPADDKPPTDPKEAINKKLNELKNRGQTEPEKETDKITKISKAQEPATFKQWVIDNKGDIGTWSQKRILEVQAKWNKLGLPLNEFPVNRAPKEKTAENGDAIWCKAKNGRVFTKVCEKCDRVKKCHEYEAYVSGASEEKTDIPEDAIECPMTGKPKPIHECDEEKGCPYGDDKCGGYQAKKKEMEG